MPHPFRAPPPSLQRRTTDMPTVPPAPDRGNTDPEIRHILDRQDKLIFAGLVTAAALPLIFALAAAAVIAWGGR